MTNFSRRLLAAAASFVTLGSVQSATAFADHAGWHEALDGKGEFGYLSDWLMGDHKIVGGSGIAASKYFKEAILGTQKLPLDLIKAGLVLQTNADRLTSAACVDAWGCNLVTPSMEMLVLRRDAAHKPILDGFYADEALWHGPGFSWRGFLIRTLGWYNDKSFVPTIVKMATHKPDSEYTMDALQSAAGLLGVWNDKSLIEPCAAVFETDLNEVSAVQPARQACAWYLVKMGDKSVAGKFKRAKMGSDWAATVFSAAMGNADDKAEWQQAAKDFAGSPDRTDHAVAVVALALSGDAKSEKLVISLLGPKNVDAAWEHATLLPLYADTAVGKRVLAATKKAVFGMAAKEKAGKVKAVVAAMAARGGDAAAVAEIKRLFAGDDEGVREVLAKTLGTGSPGVVLVLPPNGLAGGAGVAGLADVRKEAFSAETNRTARGNIGRAWAMTVPAGGK